ncbi:MAG TPA: class I SAM-dependent methyltransferase, partial [Tepidisphaeraceae bacterium]|nr:class I SAM-dependent methyltransferase [Tepidisphaeraceae bacterium]
MSMQMQEASTRRIYDIQSKVYDKTFGKLVQRRIARAIEHIDIGDTDKVLDVGVGTGAALQYYPRRGRIYGIDLSGGMLKKAQARIKELGMDHATILQADALHLPFCDDTFDHLFVSHVVTVVSDPYRLIRECQRVLKPGARIVMVNHFQSTNRFIGM